MSCNCNKPNKPDTCGISPAVLSVTNNNCTLFHKVIMPASMGDSKENPPYNGMYKNVLLYYEADQTSWLFSSDGVPTKLVSGVQDYEAAINLPQINGETLIGDKSSADFKLADAPMVITIASGNIIWSGADTAEDIYNFFLNQGKVNVVFEGSENYGYGIVSAAYIPGEQKMMCTVAVAGVDTGSSPVEFSGDALYGLMTFYTAGKAVDVGQLDLQPKLFVADFTGLNIIDGNVLEGVPATGFSIGMVKPGDGLEVASDGTLSVNTEVTHTFDTVADMKASTVLKAGDVAQTLGFHTLNDGGGAVYKITNTGTANEMNIIAVNSLFANLIVENEINIKQWGAYGDNTHDDTNVIQNVVNVPYTNSNLYFPDGSYIISSNITVPSNFTLKFDDESMLNIGSGITLTINGGIEAQLTQIFTGSGIVRGNIKVTEIYPQWWGAKGDDSNSDSAAFQSALDYLLSQTTVSTIPKLKIPHGGYRITTGLVLSVDADTNARIIIEGCGEGSKLNNVAKDQTILTLSATAGNIRRCIIKNIGFTNGQKAIELTRACYNTIEDCFFEEQSISSIEIKGSGGGSNIVTNNHFTHTAGIVLNNVGNILSNNQLGEDFRTTTYPSTASHIYIAGNDNIIANNNIAVTELDDVQGIGIFINTANKNRIVNNRITSQLGSVIVQGDFNIISDNNIQGNRKNLGRDEIVIKSTSQGNVVSNNVIVSLGQSTSPNIVSIEGSADYNVASYNIGYKQADVDVTSTGTHNVYSGLNTIIP